MQTQIDSGYAEPLAPTPSESRVPRDRYQFRRAWRSVVALMKDPQSTKHVFDIVEALSGRSSERARDRMASNPVGRRLLDLEPDLVSLLNDREALAKLPEGSLGHAYLQFVESEGIAADGLVEVDGRDFSTGPEDLRFVMRWLRDTHDLKHTLTGYRGDILGEISLLAFELGQSLQPGVLLIVAMGSLRLIARARSIEPRIPLVIAQGYVRGLRAPYMLNLDYGEALSRPLADVREEFRLGAVPRYRDVRSDQVSLLD